MLKNVEFTNSETLVNVLTSLQRSIESVFGRFSRPGNKSDKPNPNFFGPKLSSTSNETFFRLSGYKDTNWSWNGPRPELATLEKPGL